MNEVLISNIPRFMANFEAFIKDCLGHRMNSDIGFSDICKEHTGLCRFLQFDAHKFKLILMPRFSLKSCIVTQGYSLWKLIKNPNNRVLIYSDSATKSQGFLQGIKNHIYGDAPNSSFREYFPSWETDPHKGKWNESQIVVRTRTFAHVEPTVDTGGIESSKVGMHYDIIIFDDIVSDLNVTTKSQMDKVYDCYKKSLSLLKPGGEVIIVGTRWHFGDAYGRILNENQGNFGIFIQSAEDKGIYPFESIGLTKEFLEQQKKEQGSYIYSCLYKNSPVDDSTALFKYTDFNFYGDIRNIDHEKLFMTCTCDTAGDGEDFTGITVVGTDSDLNMYILDCINEHFKPNQIVAEIIRLSYKWRFQKFGIDKNMYEGMLEREIQLAADEERKNKKFKLFSTEIFTASAKRGEGKHVRILAVQPYHERGALRFPGKDVEGLKGAFSELAFQMLQYTPSHRPLHDDILDSLAYHIKLIRVGGIILEKNIPHNSPAYIIDKINRSLLSSQNGLPLRYRRFKPIE